MERSRRAKNVPYRSGTLLEAQKRTDPKDPVDLEPEGTLVREGNIISNLLNLQCFEAVKDHSII